MRQALLLAVVLLCAYFASQSLKDPHAGETPEEHAAHAHEDEHANEGHDHDHDHEKAEEAEHEEHAHEEKPSAKKDTETTMKEAIALMRAKDYQAAAKVLEAYLKNNPNDEKILVAMGRLKLRALDNPKEAIGFYQRAAELYPENTRALNGLMLSHQANMDPAAAEKALKAIENKHPNSAGVSEVLGNLYSEREDYSQANKYYRKAASLSKNPEFPLSALADSLRVQGRTGEAVKTYQEILNHHTKQLEGVTDQGEREAIKMDAALTSMELADTLIDQRRFEEAEKLLEQVRAEHAEAPVERLYQKMDFVRGS